MSDNEQGDITISREMASIIADGIERMLDRIWDHYTDHYISDRSWLDGMRYMDPELFGAMEHLQEKLLDSQV